MADEDKFWYVLVHVESLAEIGGAEYVTKDEATKRNLDMQKMGSKKHEWRRANDTGRTADHYYKSDRMLER